MDQLIVSVVGKRGDSGSVRDQAPTSTDGTRMTLGGGLPMGYFSRQNRSVLAGTEARYAEDASWRKTSGLSNSGAESSSPARHDPERVRVMPRASEEHRGPILQEPAGSKRALLTPAISTRDSSGEGKSAKGFHAAQGYSAASYEADGDSSHGIPLPRSTRLLTEMTEIQSLFKAAAGEVTVTEAEGMERLFSGRPSHDAQMQPRDGRSPAGHTRHGIAANPAPEPSTHSRARQFSESSAHAAGVERRHNAPGMTVSEPQRIDRTEFPTQTQSGHDIGISIAPLAVQYSRNGTQAADGMAAQWSAPDPAWEDSLLERLLDRWEDRIRAQSIRQFGFTGGLT